MSEAQGKLLTVECGNASPEEVFAMVCEKLDNFKK